MRILGVDCGTHTTGYGIVAWDGAGCRLVHAGVIRARRDACLGTRLSQLAEALRSVIREYGPEEAAIEEVFYGSNVRAALQLAHARGVVLLLVAEAGIPYQEYSPSEIKQSLTRYGLADKKQLQRMVCSLLGPGAENLPADASDALAVALCHAYHRSGRLSSGCEEARKTGS